MLSYSTDSDQAQAAQQLQNNQPDNQASFSHELIAGAASYEAAKAYENHCAANGRSLYFLISPFISLKNSYHHQCPAYRKATLGYADKPHHHRTAARSYAVPAK